MLATYVGSIGGIIAPSPLNILSLAGTRRPIYSNHKQPTTTAKNDEICQMPIRHRRFFRTGKVSCLIVMFLITPCRPSSAYLNSTDAALDGEWYYVLAPASVILIS